METLRTHLAGVTILTPKINHDHRGYFLEKYNEKTLEALGIPPLRVQENESYSKKYVLRGLHFQLKKPQAKLVRVTQGEILDVVADVTPHSPTYRKWVMVKLDRRKKEMLYIPVGYAHGFLVLTRTATVEYAVDEFYSGRDDQCGVRWDDPDLAINWPEGIEPILSKEDRDRPLLRDLSPENLPKVLALS